MSEKKVRVRTCVSCRIASSKDKLIRVVKTSSGEVFIDPNGKAPGRGAYLCGASDCTAAAIKTNKLGRALRCEIPDNVKHEISGFVVKDDDRKDSSGNEDNGNES